MKSRRFLLALVLVSVILIVVIVTAYTVFSYVDVQDTPMDLIVSDGIGFNADTDALHFGRVYAGGIAKRELQVQNKNSYPVLVRFKTSGKLSHWVTLEKTNFMLGPKDNTSVIFTAKPPANAATGRYSGNIQVIFKRTVW